MEYVDYFPEYTDRVVAAMHNFTALANTMLHNGEGLEVYATIVLITLDHFNLNFVGNTGGLRLVGKIMSSLFNGFTTITRRVTRIS